MTAILFPVYSGQKFLRPSVCTGGLIRLFPVANAVQFGVYVAGRNLFPVFPLVLAGVKGPFSFHTGAVAAFLSRPAARVILFFSS